MSAVSEPPATAESVGAAGPYHPIRIARVIEETPDARSFVLEIPDESLGRFAYAAGQFLTFRLRVGEERLVRCYSLASSPDVDRDHKVTVKRIDDGRVSNWMNDRLAVGDVIETMRPAGIFCLHERATPLVLFAAGSGITPVVSILKSALARTDRAVRLIYANRDAASIIFRSELDELADRHSERLQLVHRLDCDSGFVGPDDVRRYVADQSEADFYVCGPTPFMDTVEATISSASIDRSQIFVERFVSLANDSEVSEVVGASQLGDAAPAEVTVVLDGEKRVIPYTDGQTLLEAARAAGLEPPFACEEGYCSCCMAKLVRGRVHMKANDALDDQQVGDGWVLTCQSVATADEIEIEYPD